MENKSGTILFESPQGRSEFKWNNFDCVATYERLHEIIEKRIGPEEAGLFAKPHRDNSGLLKWTDPSSPSEADDSWRAQPLGSLPSDERLHVERKLRAQLAAIWPLLGDPEFGALVASAVTIDSPEGLLAVNGRPLIAGWGGVPSDMLLKGQMERHYQRTMQAYLAQQVPPISGLDEEVDEVPRSVSQNKTSFWRANRAPLIASGLALAILLVLLIPGVLIKDAAPDPVRLPRVAQDAEVNRSLEKIVRTYQAYLKQDVCKADFASRPRIEPFAARNARPTPAAPAPGNQTKRVKPQTRDAKLAPPSQPHVAPNKTPVPTPSIPQGASNPETLAALLDKAAVLVSTGKSIGSGFFVSPVLLLTNRHVVEKAPGNIIVGNKELGSFRKTELLKMTPNSAFGKPDYALLKLKLKPGQPGSRYFLSFTNSVRRLQNVIAAGYPGAVLQSDNQFQRLKRTGDFSSFPEMNLTKGEVMAVQNKESSSPLVLHRASISPGNSGGPLVDECGRVVGINTFIQRAHGGADRINKSLATKSALAFLAANNVTPHVVEGRCATGTKGPIAQNSNPSRNAIPGSNSPQPAPPRGAPGGEPRRSPQPNPGNLPKPDRG